MIPKLIKDLGMRYPTEKSTKKLDMAYMSVSIVRKSLKLIYKVLEGGV